MERIEKNGVAWELRISADKVGVLRNGEHVYDLHIPERGTHTWRVSASILGVHADGRPVVQVTFDYTSSMDAHLEPPTKYFVGPSEIVPGPNQFIVSVQVKSNGSVLYNMETIPYDGPRTNTILCLEPDGSTSVVRA